MKKDKQWLINSIYGLGGANNTWDKKTLLKAIELAEQLEEPEKVKVPKFNPDTGYSEDGKLHDSVYKFEERDKKTTLAEFLGWEVWAEYEDEDGFIYRLTGPNDLQTYYDGSKTWNCPDLEWSSYTIDKLQSAEKIEHKKYRIPLPNLITTDGMQQYLTEKKGYWFACRLTDNFKQEWTEDEFHRIPKAYRGYAKEMVK